MDSESGIFSMIFDQSGSRLLTTEADKTIKMYKEDDTAVSIWQYTQKYETELGHNKFEVDPRVILSIQEVQFLSWSDELLCGSSRFVQMVNSILKKVTSASCLDTLHS
jgi:WD40 repeat protein